jgi:hypothetical protein
MILSSAVSSIRVGTDRGWCATWFRLFKTVPTTSLTSEARQIGGLANAPGGGLRLMAEREQECPRRSTPEAVGSAPAVPSAQRPSASEGGAQVEVGSPPLAGLIYVL